MTDQTPKDPFGMFAAEAVSLHEVFTGFVSAGFTRAEALDLVKVMLNIAAQAHFRRGK